MKLLGGARLKANTLAVQTCSTIEVAWLNMSKVSVHPPIMMMMVLVVLTRWRGPRRTDNEKKNYRPTVAIRIFGTRVSGPITYQPGWGWRSEGR
jgi:hypothetical protein